MVSNKIIIFSPHPDDDILACGGTIALKIKQGCDLYVVYLTDGRNSHSHELNIFIDPTPLELAEIRKKEAIKALSILGHNTLNNLYFLGFEDGALKKNMSLAQRKIKKILHTVQPCELYFPSSWDTHQDHSITNSIILNVLKNVRFNYFGYQYTIWGNLYDPHCYNELQVDISGVFTLKKMAILEHKSQVTKYYPNQKRVILDSIFLSKFLTCTETYYYANK